MKLSYIDDGTIWYLLNPGVFRDVDITFRCAAPCGEGAQAPEEPEEQRSQNQEGASPANDKNATSG